MSLAQSNFCSVYYGSKKIETLDKESSQQSLNMTIDEIFKRVTKNEFNEDLENSWTRLEQRRKKMGGRLDYEFGALQSLFSLKIEELEQVINDRNFCILIVNKINSIKSLKGVTPGGVKKTAYGLLLSHFLYHQDPNEIIYKDYNWEQFKKIPYFNKFKYLNANPVISKSSKNFAERVLKRIEYGYNYFEPETGGAYFKSFEHFGVVNLKQGEIFVNMPHLRLPLLYDMTITEIEKLILDRNFLKLVSEQFFNEFQLKRYPEFVRIGFERFADHNLTVETLADSLIKAAQLILSFKRVQEFPASKILSYNDFALLASLEGLEIKNFPVTYRFDSRSPEEINSTHGFMPNPEKMIGPIQMHSILTSKGSRYVSLSLKEANNDVLETIGVGKFALDVETNEYSKEIKNKMISEAIANGLISDGKDVELKMVYEYRIERISGIETSEWVSVAKEREVVAPYVNSQNIVAFRKVFILYGKKFIQSLYNETVMSSSPFNISTSYVKWQQLH
jgi:hypothetical protein